MKLQDKVAIVTGAASGMGKAIAEAYAKEGAKVIVSDLNGEGAKTVADEINANGGTAIAIATNVAKDEDLQKLFDTTVEKYGQLDILVNNAGIMDGFEPVNEITDAHWDMIFAVNTTSVMKSMRIATDMFLKQGHGVIVNNISAGGLNGGRAGAAYTASKHAVVGLTKNTAFMFSQSGIRVNGIAPGAVMTNIQQSMQNVSQYGAAQQQKGSALIPRVGSPEEIAKLAVFLGSEDSSFINGQIITADAGWTTY
ncbi:SDR family oxidoreductase [Solibacillus silvestris]|uniref:SDR family oxidoreductase n=1 Tax=Solibacillus silvestris TaxID=76853 RepID=UPI003F81D2C3